MCNAYEMGGQTGSFPGFLRAEAIRELEKFRERRLIRRTDLAPVVNLRGEVEMMSWGFRRESLGVINNSRSDKLEGPMWRQAFQERRCLIPVAHYFEWKGPTGSKETYQFESPSGDWLWMAGIWEESEGHGKCFSMITTEANRTVLPIHHRMPALLRELQQECYLAGESLNFDPKSEDVLVRKCANPLIAHKPPPAQGELF